ncbi:transporter substrate-binding domain-containing protein [uncultured Campylobacter sp.]|uniref:transporter substrate-binding domain-containing protein n=1 Tax=uncultured Campylobacter sp. TaxID=218934 RepID=UPI00261B7404|nr:transporter substrate-binding domain-containing protein [uncultured Campylobacter sp.]
MKKIIFSLLFFCASLFSNSLAQIKEKGVIRIGIDGSVPPLNVAEDGKYEGFEILLIEELAKEIFGGKEGKIEYIITQGNDRINAVRDNKVDLDIAVITVTKEREKIVDFSNPYFSVNVGVLSRAGDNIKTVNDLQDKEILAESGTVAYEYFAKQGHTIRPCSNSSDCYRKLKAGEGAAYADDNLVVLAYAVVDRKVEANIINLGTSDFLAIAVQKGNDDLLDAINSGLVNLSKSGFFKKIFNETIDPYYKGTAERKYFLLDDLYKMF